LIEAGLDEDEAFAVLKDSPWNKFKGRASENDQIRREIAKIYGRKFAPAPTDSKTKNGYKMLSIPLSEVQERNIDWIWHPYLARGEISILEGDPAIGKSYIMTMISKAICDGDMLPCARGKRARLPTGKVAYFDLENSAASVTKKRMKWNGCQHMENFFQEEEPFTMDDEEKRNHALEAIEKLRPTLVVFDTLNHYIGRADIAKSNEATKALEIFSTIAKRFNCAVVLIRHLTKSGGVKALFRGQGNIALSAVARIIMTIGSDPEDEEVKALCLTKLSFARAPGGIRFTIDDLPDTLKEQDRSKLTWGDYDAELRSDDIINVEAGKKTSEEKDKASEFLQEALEEGPMKRSELEIMAEKRSISHRTLMRAADALGVVKKLVGFGAGKTSTWELAGMHEK
jgi:RecA-family ATPase